MMHGISPESIPRYAPPSPAELDAIVGAYDSPCDNCEHVVFVTDNRNSKPFRPRILVICVREHDEEFCAEAEIIDTPPVVDCPYRKPIGE